MGKGQSFLADDKTSRGIIKHKSWVDFSRSKAMGYAEIFNGLKKGLLIKKDDLAPELVVKIQEAARISEFLPTELERFFEYF